MPKKISIETYSFDELEKGAKERAREWYREACASANDIFWSEYVIEDADECARILGITVNRRRGSRVEPAIYWSGFWSQGDGACFEGRYSYVQDAALKIAAHAPHDEELIRIGAELDSVQRRNECAIWADVQNTRGNNQHVEVNTDAEKTPLSTEDEAAIREAMDAFAHWIYRALEREYEHQNADEQVDENIRANEYAFTAKGRRSVTL
jgi:hypothetical protein